MEASWHHQMRFEGSGDDHEFIDSAMVDSLMAELKLSYENAEFVQDVDNSTVLL